MSLQTDILDALAHPYQSALVPGLFLGDKKDIYQIIKIILFIDPIKLQDLKEQLNSEVTISDEQALPILRNFLIQFASESHLYKRFAKYYGLDYQTQQDEIIKQVNTQVLRPLKIAFNHVAEKNGSTLRVKYNPSQTPILTEYDAQANSEEDNKKQKTRTLKKTADWSSLALTVLVALGQAAIAATCFIAAGVAGPLFWPIFIAAFVTNFFLLKADIKSLFRKIGRMFLFKEDFLEGLTGPKRALAYGSLIFATASGLTLGIMAFATSYSAVMAILPIIGLSALAVPGVGWAIAAVIALATIPVMMALMFESMANFIKDFNDNINAIRDYFNIKKHLAGASWQGMLKFFLSRGLQIIFAGVAVAITILAVISTFGSYSSSISQAMQSFLKISANIANAVSFVVVFACNLIPELIFNFKNVLNFIFELPQQIKTACSRAAIIFHSDVHPAAKVFVFAFLATTLLFMGCVALNGYGNGKTGSMPSGDGVKFLMNIFKFSPTVAALIGLVTSTSISVAANETYGLQVLNQHEPVATGPKEKVTTASAKLKTLSSTSNRYGSFNELPPKTPSSANTFDEGLETSAPVF